jgi:hypothetical protein
LPLVKQSLLFLRVPGSLATRTPLFGLCALLLGHVPKFFAGDPDFFCELTLFLGVASFRLPFGVGMLRSLAAHFIAHDA